MTVTSGATGWPVTVGVVEVGEVDCQEQTLSGRGAHVYTAHMGWLGVVTGISAASTGGVLVNLTSGTDSHFRTGSMLFHQPANSNRG